MGKTYRAIALLVYLVLIGYIGVLGLYRLAGAQTRELVGLVMGGYERFTIMHMESVLKRVAEDAAMVKMDATDCEKYRGEVTNSGGFLAVLSIGNKEGRIVCTAHENTLGVFPDVTDRLYFQRVKKNEGMVVGEYAIARTVGKEVLHFAYPIRDKQGEFQGFVLAGVDLSWFINPRVDGYLKDQGVVVLGVDEKGKLLFSYPSGFEKLGEKVVTPEMIREMLSGKVQYKLAKGEDGVYRVFGYKTIYQEDNQAMLFLAGVSIFAFRHIAVSAISVFIVLGALGWYGFTVIWQNRKLFSSRWK